MTEPRRLTTREAADLVGVTPASWRSYVSRGRAPQPDGRLGITPWWRESTVRRWQKSRPGQGAGGGRPNATYGDSWWEAKLNAEAMPPITAQAVLGWNGPAPRG